MADEKRFSFVPLKLENQDRAVIGEIILDRASGDVWTKDENGKMVSATADLDKKVSAIVEAGVTTMSYAFLNNRQVYRFYFENEVVRLDRSLVFHDPYAYYRIRDLADDTRYFVSALTEIGKEGASIYPFENNENYFVEFYNVKRELISTQIFSAKYAPAVIVDGDPAKIANRLEIVTTRDYMWNKESINSFAASFFCVFEDGSRKEVTDSTSLMVDGMPISTDEVGMQTITGRYYYDTTNGQYVEATKQIEIKADIYPKLSELVVMPKKIIRLNDGTKSIVVQFIAYYDDGTVKDVTDEAIISSNFNDKLFNTTQFLTVKLNAGHVGVIEENVEIMVRDDGTVGDNRIFFDGSIFRLAPAFGVSSTMKYYRVRDPENINFYYTMDFDEVSYDASYVDKEDDTAKLKTGDIVIVEYYDADKKLVESEVFQANYKVL